MTRLIHVLTGCTATGKTELALRWAEAAGAEIVSCDSLLFYRGLDIGTAKPTRDERARVPHHLIDICDLRDRMDVTRFVALARTAVDDILGRGRPVLVVGGSGFYLKSFFAPVADDVDVPAELRAEIRTKLEREGLPGLVAELQALNPAGLGQLDVQNPRRAVRALERCRASGRPLADLRAEFEAQASPFADCEVRLAEIVRDPTELETRLAQRVQEMIAAGLVDEVRAADRAGLRENPSAAGAIGYRETLAFLDGRLAFGQLAPEIVKNTRALVKKQRTWFRTQLPAHATVTAATEPTAIFSVPKA
ncbi:MAG TPA: tRNA (adenosine(37)-N6)-dimethylallyltransferase MiaA [Candidatus Didemnitutus sp.]|nr:tRNA (adenosine(37)-N6)-dimethylallyltransferase MiaA [Candidatus Didemnitutus sp.]